ncbi:phosphopantetheine-binding protein [Streptomyces sp. NBC_01476]|uniref:phosphopantetheine-binding protein n=1 Tax=Streptomyces sp. NBC_01476 TaxID=2903881 RepID=UPI002E35CC66|nr:phosphopantetheine-binding protein [Streptomyces sp. NBC_01476]
MTPNPAGPTVTEGGTAPSPAPDAAAGEPGGSPDPFGLRRTVADVLGVAPERIGDDDNLVALGVDSVKVMTISARLRRHRLRVGFARMIEEPTLQAWWRLIDESAGEGRPGPTAGEPLESGSGTPPGSDGERQHR